MVVLLAGAGLLAWQLWLPDAGEGPVAPASDHATATGPGAAPQPAGPTNPTSPARTSAASPARAAGETVLSAGWGTAPDQMGRRVANESNPEAPMGIALDSRGGLLLLDQVNQRVLRLGRDGVAGSPLAINSSTAQDLAVGPDGKISVLDRHGRQPGIDLYDAGGRRLGRLDVVGGRVKEGGAITGLFHGPDGTYVETDNDDLVRVADKDGKPTDLEQTIPGRPSRDGKLYLKAGIASRPAGRVYVQAHRKDSTLVWETPLVLGRPVLQILLLDSDSAGNVYLGAEVGREDPKTHKLLDLATIVLRLSGAGQLTGALQLPPTTASAAETFRPLAVSPDGRVYQMVPGPKGITVKAYKF